MITQQLLSVEDPVLGLVTLTATHNDIVLEVVPIGASYPSLSKKLRDPGAVLGLIPGIATTPTPKAVTPTELTPVPASITSVELLPANPNRSNFVICNDSTSDLSVSLSGTATTNAPRLLKPGAILQETEYTGVVTGVWVTAVGQARLEEGNYV